MGKTKRKRKPISNEVTLIERAKTGRAACRYCGELIADNTVRYGVEALYRAPTGHSNIYHKYYYPQCTQQVGIKVSKSLQRHKLLVKTPRFAKDDYKYFAPSEWTHSRTVNAVLQNELHVHFILKIEEPFPNSDIPFKLTLIQRDQEGNQLTAPLVYPHPEGTSGQHLTSYGKNNYIAYDSIHRLMQASYFRTKRTPADIFGLTPLLPQRKKRWEEDQAFKRAADRAAENYRNSNNCACTTQKLVVMGCVCGAFEAELKQATRQENLAQAMSTSVSDFVNSGGSHIHQLNAVPEKKENSLVTAKEVLDAVVSTRYADLAEQVADARAQIDIDREALVPGMKVYHKITNHRYILLQKEGSNWLARRLADHEDATIEPAVISCKPNSLEAESQSAGIWLAALGIIAIVIPLAVIIVGLALRA